MPEGCVLLQGTSVPDSRGVLTFVEGGSLPFEIKRMFWITNVPEGKTRGGHAHVSCSEAVFAVQGAFSIYLSNGGTQITKRISSPGEGVVVPSGVWCNLKDFTADCVCVVAASQPYEANGYINTYEEYLKYKERTKG